MNYRHIYHAGNFADVVKHLVLIITLDMFKRKERPISVLDVFGGVGVYDLLSIEANKTLEYSLGIELLQLVNRHKILVDDYIQEYLKIVDSVNRSLDSARYYPGSPYIIANSIREQDSFDVCELHPIDIIELKRNKKRYRFYNSSLHYIDGYVAMKSLIPLKHASGVILIDPAYEDKNECVSIMNGLNMIYKKARNVTTIVWYPIKDNNTSFQKDLHIFAANLKHDIMHIDFSIANAFCENINELSSIVTQSSSEVEFPQRSNIELIHRGGFVNSGLRACGLSIINPPNIYDNIAKTMNILASEVYRDSSAFKISYSQ